MSSTSVNLSDRIFFTVEYTNGTAYIGELDGKQKLLCQLNQEELYRLVEFLQECFDLTDLGYHKKNKK